MVTGGLGRRFGCARPLARLDACSFYATRAGRYGRVYGSLGNAAGPMTRAWFSSAAVLAGAALDAEPEREAST